MAFGRRGTGPGLAIRAALLCGAIALAGCGGGGADEGTVAPPRTGPATAGPSTAPPTTTRPAAPGATAPRSTSTQSGGGEEPIRVPVTLTFRTGGRVAPPAVTVPAFVAVEVTLVSADGRAHELRLDERGRTHRLAVGAGTRVTVRLPGLRAGSYRLRAPGGGRGVTMTAGGEAGP
jgi:hypothetical protein